MNSLNKEVFRFLEGRWDVERRFEGSYQGSFTGEASFVPSPDEASTSMYNEQGELTDGEGQQFAAKQSYLYRLAGEKLEVLKKEESEWMVMHELDFQKDGSSATASHVHLCGQDHYAGTFKVDFSGGWEVAYTVNGQKKDYRIRSVYSRV